MSARTLLPVVFTLAASLAACGGDRSGSGDTSSADTANTAVTPTPGTSTPGQVTPQLVALGDSIFKGQAAAGICYTCHGPDAKGTALAPNLTDSTWLNGDGSLTMIANVVRQGVPTPKQHPAAMPPFGQTFTPQQVDAVSAYVYSLTHPTR